MFFQRKKGYKRPISPRTKELFDVIGHIIADANFKELKKHRHHLFFSRYEHLINVSFLAFRYARFLKADVETCILAGLLHDYHFTKLKSYSHALIAAENAEKFGVSEEVIEIIRSHMYPLGRSKITRARGRNFWIVKMADVSAMIFEITYSVLFLSFKHNRIKLKRTKLLMEMLDD